MIGGFKMNWKKIIVWLIIILFLGTIISVALINFNNIDILNKIP